MTWKRQLGRCMCTHTRTHTQGLICRLNYLWVGGEVTESDCDSKRAEKETAARVPPLRSVSVRLTEEKPFTDTYSRQSVCQVRHVAHGPWKASVVLFTMEKASLRLHLSEKIIPQRPLNDWHKWGSWMWNGLCTFISLLAANVRLNKLTLIWQTGLLPLGFLYFLHTSCAHRPVSCSQSEGFIVWAGSCCELYDQ